MLAFVALTLLPVILVAGQDTTPAAANSSTSDSTPAASTPAAASSASSGSFTAPTVTDTVCGNKQQNFNQCVTKVSKDINGCGTSNLCLCQTYANIAACYNACPDLEPTKQGYTDQSATYCSQAGVKLNNTATATATANTTSTTTTNTPAANTSSSTATTPKSSTGSTTTPTSSTSNQTAASTFAAKSGGANKVYINSGILAAVSAAVMSVIA